MLEGCPTTCCGPLWLPCTDKFAVGPLVWLAVYGLTGLWGAGACSVGEFTCGEGEFARCTGDVALRAGDKLRVDRFALPLEVGRFQYVADPNPLGGMDAIGSALCTLFLSFEN